jgi:hypothetical protein
MIDPEEDFEGCIEGLAAQVLKEIEAVPEADRPEWFVMRAAERLYSTKGHGIAWLTEHHKRILIKRIAELPVYCTDYKEPK